MKGKVSIIGKYIWFLLFLAAGFAICSLCSCKTKYIPVETVREVYVAKTDTFLQKDSVFCHDSVFIHSKGDTVWFEKWHTKYKDRIVYQTKVDTFIKTDSIQIPYPIERELSDWEKFTMGIGKFAYGALSAGLIIFLIWLLHWIRRKDK